MPGAQTPRRPAQWKRILPPAACGLLAVVLACLAWRGAFLPAEMTPTPALPSPSEVSAPPSPSQTSVLAPTAPSSPSPEETPSPPRVMEESPARIRISALDVDAEIRDTGVEESGRMEVVASASVISWLRESAIPGNEGNAVLAGHNRWAGHDGQLIAMDTLEVGDEMEIEYAGGETRTFFLESVFVYALKTAPGNRIMEEGGLARVTLITCKGPYNRDWGTSENRIVAIFKAEEDFVVPDPPVTPFPTLTPA